ncbi:hypothetical protein FRB96_001209 [Tulasnella sp. 330]|nr:hypothetical protein FRB96_001209 [Tulasnella sp. 330]KAG8881400.1 hypothetical protein FRB97_009595 [Tulasnella sp. 331]
MCFGFRRGLGQAVNIFQSNVPALTDALRSGAHLWPAYCSPAPRRKALLIGIRYTRLEWPGGGSMELMGTHNDVERWRDDLIRSGYPKEDIRILWDKEGISPDSRDYPNRKNILREMRVLTAGIKDFQRRFLVFCGHRKGRLPDGSDSAILGIDVQNPISDKDLDVCLLDPLTKWSHLTVSLVSLSNV